MGELGLDVSQTAPTIPTSDARDPRHSGSHLNRDPSWALNYSHLDPFYRRACLALGLATIAVGLYYQFGLWQLDANGFTLVGKRLPYWDFSNLWGGSVMALQGHVDYLFDAEAYRRALDAIFSKQLPLQEWSYPPHLLLIGVPLALLPIWLAYLVWSLGTLFAFHLALKHFRLPPLAHVFVLLNPAIWSNQVFGQNGALTAALLLAGLTNARARPVLAGAFFGLLTIKPHLGVLVPFALLASRNWTAIASACMTAAILFVVTGLCFGFDVWPKFLIDTRQIMTTIMEHPYPQAYHTHAATVFVTMRSLGADLPLAYAAQLAITALAAASVAWLWRPANPLDDLSRAAITAVLAILVTPYGYTHDTAPLFVAIVWFLLWDKRPNVIFLAAIWVAPFVAPSFHKIGFSAGSIAPLTFAIYLMVRYGWQPAVRPGALGEGDVRMMPELKAS